MSMTMQAPPESRHQTRIVRTFEDGWRAECSCGWTGLLWSIPGRTHVTASKRMAGYDVDEHLREVAAHA